MITHLSVHRTMFFPSPDKEHKKPALRKVKQVCNIPFRSTLFPSYFHSFGMTENYIIFVEQPFKLDIVRLATAIFRSVNWASCLKYDKEDIVSYTCLITASWDVHFYLQLTLPTIKLLTFSLVIPLVIL